MRGLIRQSTALAFMRQGEHDIRPDLLLYVVQHDDERFPRLFCYGCNYLTVWLQRSGQSASEDAIQLAVSDALSILRTRRAPWTLKERAKELRLRLRTFRALRAKAAEMFNKRYVEAVTLYREASRGNDLHPRISSLKPTPARQGRRPAQEAQA